MRQLVALLTVATIASVSVADAQTDQYGEPVPVVATSLQELRPLLKVGTSVVVTDITGVKVRGRLVSVQPPSFGALAKYPLSLPDEPIRAWWADDGVANGATRGLLLGIPAGALILSPVCAGGLEEHDSLLTCIVLASLYGGGGGAAVGAIVDGL